MSSCSCDCTKELVVILGSTCNRKCGYCIGASHLSDRSLLDLDRYEKYLKENDLNLVILMGGEVTVLPDDHVIRAIELSKKYVKRVQLFSVLANIKPYLLDPDIHLNVSWHNLSPDILAKAAELDREFELHIILTKEIVDRYTPKQLALKSSLLKNTLVCLTYCETNDPKYFITEEEYLRYWDAFYEAMGSKGRKVDPPVFQTYMFPHRDDVIDYWD